MSENINITEQAVAVQAPAEPTTARSAIGRLLATFTSALEAYRAVRPVFPSDPRTNGEWSAAMRCARSYEKAFEEAVSYFAERGDEPLPAPAAASDAAKFHGLRTHSDVGRLLRKPPTRAEFIRALAELRDRL